MMPEQSETKPTPAAPAPAPSQVFVIPTELYVAICEILKKQPWEQVHGVLAALMQLRPVQMKPGE